MEQNLQKNEFIRYKTKHQKVLQARRVRRHAAKNACQRRAHTDYGKPSTLQCRGDKKRGIETEDGSGSLQPAHGDRGTCGAHLLRRLQTDHRMGREPQGNTGIRQFPFVHKRRHGCASLLSDILQHCRRTGSRLLLSGHDDIRPAGNHRHSKAAAARHAGGNDNPRMARRESVRIRQAAPKSHSSQGDIP